MAPSVEKSEPSKERKPKIKKSTPITILKPKIKYFVEATINVKGQRKEVGYIIETDDEKKVYSEFNKALKKDFSGIRNITGKKYKEATDEDIPYDRVKIETISNSSTTNLEALNNSSDKTTLDELKESIRSDLDKISVNVPDNIWKVVITPGRRPRQRDFNSNYVYAIGNNEKEVKQFCCDRLGMSTNELKDKWIKMYPCSFDNIIKNDSRFIDFCAKEIQSNNDIKESLLKSVKDVEEDFNENCSTYGQLFNNFKNFNVNYDINHNIISVNLEGVSILDVQKLKKFKVRLDDLPTFEMIDVDIHNVIAHLLSLFERESDLDKYRNTKTIEIVDVSKNLVAKFSLEKIFEGLKKGI